MIRDSKWVSSVIMIVGIVLSIIVVALGLQAGDEMVWLCGWWGGLLTGAGFVLRMMVD